MKAPIHSVKHFTQMSLFTVTPAATLVTKTVFEAVQATLANLNAEIREGAIVKAVWLELWLQSDDTSSSTFNVTIEKVPGSGGSMDFAESQSLFTYENKKNIFYTTQGLVGPNDEFPLNAFKGWIKIPKSKQRMGLGDKIVLNISAISNGLSACGILIFKEYY